MLYIVFLCIQVLFGILFFFLTVALFTGAPYVPSQKKAVRRMIELADIASNDSIYDLGSGDGRLLFEAAKQTTGNIIGIEINPLLVLLTQIKKILYQQTPHVHCVWGNFWKTDLSAADVVFVYLLPWKMEALQKKLQQELKPGTRVVSNSFIFPQWKMTKKDEQLSLYVFNV